MITSYWIAADCQIYTRDSKTPPNTLTLKMATAVFAE
jgi:hypothetical protein